MTEAHIFVAALIHGNERYVVVYDDANKRKALDTVVRWIMDPRLSLTMSQGIRLSHSINGVTDGPTYE